MPTRAQVCTWIAAAGLVVPSVATGQGRTEREIVELIVRDGPQARAIRAESEVTRREQAARLAYPNPAVTYSREGAGFTEFFQAEQSLSLFGARDALSRAGVAATAAAEAERDRRLWLLRSDAAAAVARVVAEQERLESLRAHMREVERLIEILRAREREGEGSRFDRLRAEQELRDTNQVVTSSAVALAEARTTISGMLPPDALLTTVTATEITESPVPLESLFTRATSSRAELRALEQLGQRATFEGDAARKARLPSPSLFGGVKRADELSGRKTGGVFGVTVALPLFDRGGREGARWEAERLRVEAERMFIEYRIRSEITGASAVLTLRHAALSQDQQEGAAEELVQIAVVAYREGEVGILELLDAARTASRARTRSIDLRLEARLAQLALERAVGDTLWP